MSDKFYIEEDDSISFLVDGIEVTQIRVALSKQNVRILEEHDAISNSDTGEISDVDLRVEGSIEDIEFALADLIKYVRPYLKPPKR